VARSVLAAVTSAQLRTARGILAGHTAPMKPVSRRRRAGARPGRRTGATLYPCTLLAWMLLASIPAAHADSATQVDERTRHALALDVHPENGARVFAEHCARCHGPGAGGDAQRAIPALAGQRFAYLVRQLVNFAGEQRDSDTMHEVVTRRALRSPQTWVDVAGHLNRLPTTATVGIGDGRHLALGGAIFQEQCSSCHAESARGDADGFVPSLRHQHYSYLLAQTRRIGHGDRHNIDENLGRFLAGFEEDEVEAVADYLSRLQGERPRTPAMRDDGTVVD